MAPPNPALNLKMFLPLGIVYAMNKVDMKDENNILYMRLFFACGSLLLTAIWAYIWSLASNNSDEAVVKVSEKDMQPPNPLADAMGANKHIPDEKKEMTVAEYDMKQVRQKLQQVVMQVLIVGGIHYKWGTTLPLVMSSLMGLMNLPEDPLVRIYLFGATAADDSSLKRPFKAKSPFGDAMAELKKKQEGDKKSHKKVPKKVPASLKKDN